MFNEIYTGNFEINTQEIWEDRLDHAYDTFKKYENMDGLMVEIIRSIIMDKMSKDHVVVIEEVETELAEALKMFNDDTTDAMEIINDLRGMQF